jgi:flagellar basal body-associated protein FliL
MKSRTLIVAIAVTFLVIIAGGGTYLWQTSQRKGPETVTQKKESQTYSGNSFTVQYPNIYQVSTDNMGLVTISGSNGKIMIGEFEPAAAPVATEDMTQAELDEFPKNIIYHGYEGNIASAIYYKSEDEKARTELESIQDSIKLK